MILASDINGDVINKVIRLFKQKRIISWHKIKGDVMSILTLKDNKQYRVLRFPECLVTGFPQCMSDWVMQDINTSEIKEFKSGDISHGEMLTMVQENDAK